MVLMCLKLYDLNMHPATRPNPQLPCASMRSLILLQLLHDSHYPSACRFLEHFPVDLFWKSWYDLSMPSLTPKIIGGHTYYYARYCHHVDGKPKICLLYTSPSPRDRTRS